jgi:Fe2+ transport system protein FeoA
MTLADLAPGQGACVLGLHHPDGGGRHARRLMAMGVLPGTRLRLLRRSPAFVFQLGHSQFAVDADLAKAIMVQLKDDDDGMSN